MVSAWITSDPMLFARMSFHLAGNYVPGMYERLRLEGKKHISCEKSNFTSSISVIWCIYGSVYKCE